MQHNYARVMVIMAHPDDLEYFCGGTLALLSEAGSTITSLLLTDGEKGCSDPTKTTGQIAALRRIEQQAAAEVLGIAALRYLGYPDGALLDSPDLRRAITAEVRRARPELVLLPDPTRYYFGDWYVNHPDHRGAGEAGLAAVMPAANNRWYFPELLEDGLEPHQTAELWLTTPSDPNHSVDITAVIERKIRAFLCHASQYGDAAVVSERMLREARTEDAFGIERYHEQFRVMHL
ncbi:MAG: PIG-L family deacetylase [Chloroflexi bacterium]|nr:PIG-L family deacetylase [Chloroflexota bacterium]